MSDVGLSLRDQIKGAVEAASNLRPIQVEAWGTDDEPLVIYARPLTVALLKKIEKHANAKRGNQVETLVYTIIFAALDAQGEPIFDLSDKPWLLEEADSGVLADVVLQINTRLSYEDIEGN